MWRLGLGEGEGMLVGTEVLLGATEMFRGHTVGMVAPSCNHNKKHGTVHL